MMINLRLDCIRDTYNLSDKYAVCGMFEIILNIKDRSGCLILVVRLCIELCSKAET